MNEGGNRVVLPSDKPYNMFKNTIGKKFNHLTGKLWFKVPEIVWNVFTFCSFDDMFLRIVLVNKVWKTLLYSELFTKTVLLERLENRSEEDKKKRSHETFLSLLSLFALRINDEVEEREQIRRSRYLRKFLFGGFKSEYMSGQSSAVKSFTLKNISSSISMDVGEREFFRIHATVTCLLSKFYVYGNLESFNFQIVLYCCDIYSSVSRSTRNRRLSQKMDVGEYFRFEKAGILDYIEFGKDKIELFTLNGMRKMLGYNQHDVNGHMDFDSFLQKVKLRKKRQRFVSTLSLDVDMMFTNKKHEDSNLTKVIENYARLGALIEKKSEECLINSNVDKRKMMELIFDIGLKVVNGCNKNMRHFVENNKNRYLESNSVPFLVTNRERGGKKTVLLENLVVENIEFEEEVKKFDEFADDNYPSRFNPEFLNSDHEYVLDYEIENCFKRFPTLSKLVCCFIRSETENEKHMRVLGIVSVIYSSVRKHNKYFAKYFHPIFLSFGFQNSAFKFLNRLLGICYSKKSETAVQDIAKVRIEKSKKLKENDAVILTQDNITLTNYFSNPVNQFLLTSNCYFIRKLNFRFNGYYQKVTVEYSEIEDLYLKTEDLNELINNSTLEIVNFISNKKSSLRKFVSELASNTLEVFNLKPDLVEAFSNKEITRCVKDVFQKNFDPIIPNSQNFECHISDLGYYPQASRIYKLLRLKFPGWFHTEMALGELVWNRGKRYDYMEINCDENLNFKCSYEWKGSKYPQYRDIITKVACSRSDIISEYRLTYEELENGEYNNHKIKSFLCMHFLEQIYMYVMALISRNEYERLVKLLPFLKDLFSLAGKTNYKNATFETMIVHKLMKAEVFEFIKQNRLVSVQRKDKFFPVDKLGEIQILYQKKIKVNMKGIESWQNMVPIYNYFMYNYRNEISSYMKSKKQLKDIDVSMMKWKIEKDVDYITKLYIQEINPNNLDRDVLVKTPAGVVGVGLLGGQSLIGRSPSKLFRQIRYLFSGRREIVKEREKWDRAKIDLWNKNGTIYAEKRDEDEEDGEYVDDTLSETWSEKEKNIQKEDDSGFYIPSEDEDEDDHIIHGDM